jgi:CBS domain-containing protein
MKIQDIMSKSIASINANDSVEQAAFLMKEHNVGSVPVCDGEKVVGIITDRDIALRSVAEGENFKNQQVRTIMTSNPVTGSPDMEVNAAAKLMSDKQVRRLPIVENDALVGIVSLGDIAIEPNLENNAQDALKNISEPCAHNI